MTGISYGLEFGKVRTGDWLRRHPAKSLRDHTNFPALGHSKGKLSCVLGRSIDPFVL
jgi:hypothetical protein